MGPGRKRAGEPIRPDFEIIQLLRRAAKPVTAQALAETLEVVPRTVYRDR